MQTSIEHMMNTAKGILVMSLRASTMKRVPILMGLSRLGGGVLGSAKHNNPNRTPAAPAMIKIFGLLDIPRPPTTKPATIQPMVPQTLSAGKSLRSLMLVNATVLLSPKVGM